jgi:chromosome segregation ATPase
MADSDTSDFVDDVALDSLPLPDASEQEDAIPQSERVAASPPSPVATTSSSRPPSRSSFSSGANMESRLSGTGNSMKNMKVSMESERMFNDMEDEINQPSPTRDIRSRLSSVRAASPINGTSGNASRVSVKDQLYALECKVQSHEDTIQKLMSIHQADKALLMAKIEEITERMGEELHKLRVDYQKKLNTASEEIERLNKCLNVQRGHITTLQEQCQSLHKHVVQVDDDVTKLATEVLGD